MTLKRKEPLLHVENIEKYYGNPGAVTKALDQVSFDEQAGEFISIMGASGSGKTTLLNCISTIDTVSSGHILLDGQDITTITEKNIAAFRRDYLGFVFQDFNLLDTLTLEENVGRDDLGPPSCRKRRAGSSRPTERLCQQFWSLL